MGQSLFLPSLIYCNIGTSNPIKKNTNMKLFRQLIASKTTSLESENRLDKLGDEPQSTLEALVEGTQGDPGDMDIRVAAVGHLSYGAPLRKAAAGAPAALEKAARVKLAELLSAGQITVSQLMADVPQTETRLAIASHCGSGELEQATLAGIEDQTELASLCTTATSAAVRKTLAERINEPDLLRDLLKTFKNKDKSAYKIIKNALDEQKAAKDAQIQIEAAIADLCTNIEQHRQRFVDKDYRFKTESLARRWSEVEDHAEDVDKKRFTAALDVCRDRVREEVNKQQNSVEAEIQDEVEAGTSEETPPEVMPQTSAENEVPTEHETAAAEDVDPTENAREKELRESRQKQVRIIGGLIRKSHTAAEQGRLKQALGIRHSIDEKRNALDSLPGNLAARLESLDEAIQKLVDWQAYAVVPKKQALVDSMEALVGADLPPDALATRIRKLQDEWKSLTQSGKDRQEDLWHRFSEAADKAYEPCKDYFQELSVVRKQNLGKRKTLVKQLQEYLREYDWENADWRQVEKVLHNAREELHSYSPVDRGASKSIGKAFDDAMAAIQAKLEEEYSRNRHAKELVIAQADKLADMADLGQAMDTAKRLQAQWKQIGRCNYRENERLWKEFRRHCDAVFARKENAMAEEKALLGGNLAQANELISELKKTLQLNGEELLATRAERDRMAQAFRDLGPLPGNADKVTRRNFTQNLEAYDEKVRKELQRAELDAWTAAFSINAAINDYQMAILKNTEDSETATDLKSDIHSSIDATTRWPDGAQSRIKLKLETTPQGEPESNRKALTLLCIRTEILADVATPAEDKALRMEYQVNLLKKGLGQATTTSPESLALEWLEVGPVAPDAYQALYQRFESLWQKLI